FPTRRSSDLPDAVRDVFTASPHDLYAGVTNAVLGSVLGPGSLFVLDGDRHLRERRLLLPPFRGERMHAYGELISEVTRAEVARWHPGAPISLSAAMRDIALEIILRAVFGLDEGDRLVHLRGLLHRLL